MPPVRTAPARPVGEPLSAALAATPVESGERRSLSKAVYAVATQERAVTLAQPCELILFPEMGSERDQRPSERIKLLFVCRTHAILSPMAEGLARAAYTRLNISVQSAGLTADPLDAEAVAVMGEIGIDIAPIEAVSVRDLDLAGFDIVVSLGMHRLGVGRHQMAVAWETPEFRRLRRPRPLARLRDVRDALSARVRGLGAVLTATNRA